MKTQRFNKLTSQKFASRLPQANLTSKNDIAALVKKKKDFHDKLKKLNKKVTPNKTKHVEDEKKISDLKINLNRIWLFIRGIVFYR